MKRVSVRQFQQRASHFLDRFSVILLTRYGKPLAIVKKIRIKEELN